MKALEGRHILVTGGSGFIGSNLVAALLAAGAKVRVLDDLSTGNKSNLDKFQHHPNFEFLEGSITDLATCEKAVLGIDAISHQAALGSVPRSIAQPHQTHFVNATGFLNMLDAARTAGIKRFVYASSSSVYGDSTISPKTIGSEGNLLSPYAVTKQLNEMYAKVYAQLHQMETIGLRYFNVFGPNQDPNGVYAAAIPKFIDAMMNGKTITIHGDGGQTRDFTFVENAVQANMLGLTVDHTQAFGQVYNVACGEYYSLNQVVADIRAGLKLRGKLHPDLEIVHGPERQGDIRDSLADISATTEYLGYKNPISFSEGLEKYLNALIG